MLVLIGIGNSEFLYLSLDNLELSNLVTIN